MVKYLIKRVLLFIPTLILVSLLAFGLSKVTPNDPVKRLCESEEGLDQIDAKYQAQNCRNIAASLGLDKPPFYLTLSAVAYPDTLYNIYNEAKRSARENLIAQYGNWDYIEDYFKDIAQLKAAYYELPDSLNKRSLKKLFNTIGQLDINYKDPKIKSYLHKIENFINKNNLQTSEFAGFYESTQSAYTQVLDNPDFTNLYIPSIRWHGFNNQYHHWISHFMVGDFGISYATLQPASTRIWEAVRWTILINLISIFIAFLISIPLGVFAATKEHTWIDRLINTALFLLYSLPSFWIATMMVIFITTPEYGMDWFPTAGLGDLPEDASFWEKTIDLAYHLVLPVICVTYMSLAFITRQVRGGMLSVLNQDYIRTAQAKGLGQQQVVWRHAFRNTLFPLITMFAAILPAVFSGSVVVEIIFNIPGMGRLALDSIFGSDWPIVYTILMFSSILTILGILMSDILYKLADPRISFRE